MERPRISINEARKQRASDTVRTTLELKGMWAFLTPEEKTNLVRLFTEQIDHCLIEEEETWIVSAAQSMKDLRSSH